MMDCYYEEKSHVGDLQLLACVGGSRTRVRARPELQA